MTETNPLAPPFNDSPATIHATRRAFFTPAEWVELAGLYAVIALLHALGWGMFLYYASGYASLAGLGFAAYMFGLRHAFDADHIAAVDDTVRYMLQKGEKPLAVGFFFSLGHSTIVFLLSASIIFAATTVKQKLPALQHIGGIVGIGVSGIFLWIVGVLNLFVLLDMLRVWRIAKTGQHAHTHMEDLLQQRGWMNRLFGGRLQKTIVRSWQMYPLGVLFGLGFDTASEVGLLTMTGAASAADLPVGAVLCLPILFAAGMSAMDTTDGVLMVKAYNWAFVNPLRKIFYNITTTGLSVAVALVIGTIELIQVLVGVGGLKAPFFRAIGDLGFGELGYLIVGMFIASWALSVLVWKIGRVDESVADSQASHAHPHSHAVSGTHSHEHFH